PVAATVIRRRFPSPPAGLRGTPDSDQGDRRKSDLKEEQFMSVSIRVWSDYVCPFCLLAEGPIHEATEGLDVTVEWMPFELRPHPTPTLRPEGDYLQNIWARVVYPMARRMGVPIHLPDVSP